MTAKIEIDMLKVTNNINQLFQSYQNYKYKFIDLRNNC